MNKKVVLFLESYNNLECLLDDAGFFDENPNFDYSDFEFFDRKDTNDFLEFLRIRGNNKIVELTEKFIKEGNAANVAIAEIKDVDNITDFMLLSSDNDMCYGCETLYVVANGRIKEIIPYIVTEDDTYEED